MQSRGCPLRGLPATPTLEAHKQRFVSNGWEKAEALDLDTIYKDYLDPAEKRRCFWLLCMCMDNVVRNLCTAQHGICFAQLLP